MGCHSKFFLLMSLATMISCSQQSAVGSLAPANSAISTQKWTWVSGSNIRSASGVYGTMGTGSTSNVPGARFSSISWIDASGNLWLFGGSGYDSAGNSGNLNDLWEYTLSTQKWTWVSGANTRSALGVYGTLGTGSTSNTPGARQSPVSWIDAAGNLWLFGGTGFDSAGNYGNLNDLWEYTPSTQKWTWVGGSNTTGASGVYGTMGTGSTSNVPGARYDSVSWIDTTGNLWLFGGTQGANLNDLWEYTPSTQKWTWVSGSNTTGALGVYGTKGTGSTSNTPGARQSPVSWIDAAGNLWLFGGTNGAGSGGNLNDLWEYTPSTQKWTWVGGSNTTGASGVYGTMGTGSTSNVPGARFSSISWIDAAGNLWLFGGDGYNSTGIYDGLNDLWEFTPSTQKWTWVSGSNTGNAPTVYGTMGTGSTGNTPGKRYGSVSWIDTKGNLWLFGGEVLGDSAGNNGLLNDLWMASP